MLVVHVGGIQSIELTWKTRWEVEQPSPWEIAPERRSLCHRWEDGEAKCGGGQGRMD